MIFAGFSRTDVGKCELLLRSPSWWRLVRVCRSPVYLSILLRLDMWIASRIFFLLNILLNGMIKDIFCCDKIYINIKFTIFNHF